ncbi:rpa-associated protein [Haloferax sp. S1W]|uniref:rpa-associated protein n=1 Tax=Haloferax sp. S1W TaxID=3377110 RepID=UPI0037C718DD
MSSSPVVGTREVAYRVFATEFDDASLSYSESDEERAPNYVVTPTGARLNRTFVAGVLTEVEPVNDEVLRGRVADPTGAFVTYAGQYQPEAMAFLEQTTPPAFVALTGKARTYEPDDSDVVFTSVRPESVNDVDADVRDRWVVTAAESTLHRIAVFDEALSMPYRGESLQTALEARGVDPTLAAGIPRAIDHYGTTRTYLEAMRALAVQTLELVAGERKEVDQVTISPDEPGDATLGALPELDLEPADAVDIEASEADEVESEETVVADDAEAVSADESVTADATDESVTADATDESVTAADDVTAADEVTATDDVTATDEQPAESASAETEASVSASDSDVTPSESELDLESAEPEPEPAESEPEEPEPEVESEPASEQQTESSDELGDFDDLSSETTDAPSETGELGDFDDTDSENGALGDDGSEAAEAADGELGDFGDTSDSSATDDAADATDPNGMYELDDEERAEIESEFGTEFTSGAEVDPAGEADIDVPDVDELEDEADAEPTTESEPVSEEPTLDVESEPEPEPAAEPEPEPEPEPAAEPEPEPASDDGESAADAEADDVSVEDVNLEAVVVDAMERLDDGDGAARDAVVESVVDEYGVDAAAVDDAIEEALLGGRCYEPKEDVLKAI